jgi:hypothetical protein
VTAHSSEARARQAEKQRRHSAEVKAWNPSTRPEWLTEEFYREKIQARLWAIKVPAISAALGLSVPFAAEIRAGRQLPHQRHWQTIARILDVSQATTTYMGVKKKRKRTVFAQVGNEEGQEVALPRGYQPDSLSSHAEDNPQNRPIRPENVRQLLNTSNSGGC